MLFQEAYKYICRFDSAERLRANIDLMPHSHINDHLYVVTASQLVSEHGFEEAKEILRQKAEAETGK